MSVSGGNNPYAKNLRGFSAVVFSSLLFVFAFLSINLLIYIVVPKCLKNAVLIAFSIIFYAWSGPKYLILLLLVVLVSYLCGILTDRSYKKSLGKKKKDIKGRPGRFWCVLCVVLLILVLGFFKYTGFFIENIFIALGIEGVSTVVSLPFTGVSFDAANIVLPIGISFYIFQLLSYNIDVYRRDTKVQKNYFKLLLYAGLFHQCIAGPIVRYDTIAAEIDDRSVNAEDIFYGIRRFAIGLAKKALLANACAKIADNILPSDIAGLGGTSTAALWLGMVYYTLQIYLDYSAYSDMAIGMGRMIGFHYLENFDYPYIARSVRDFWRRWHISLSTFFRDYVYIPLGGNRCSKFRWVFNMLVVWLLTGFWHGASWNFVLWGIFYFVLLVIEGLILKKMKLPPVIGNIYALLIVLLGWVLFRFDDFELLQGVIFGMFGQGVAISSIEVKTCLLNNCFFLPVAIVACTPLAKVVRAKILESTEKSGKTAMWFRIPDAILPAALIALSTAALVGNSYNPFLYFRF